MTPHAPAGPRGPETAAEGLRGPIPAEMQRDPLTPPRAPSVFLGIQALRFLAALLVVCTHATLYVSERLDPALGVWHPGAHGVEVFFVISGFVMAATSAPYRRDGGWLVFAKRRIARIVPLYWLALALKSLISVFGSALVYHSQFAPASLAKSLLFVPFRNELGRIEPLLGVGWTLNFEVVFYALFAVALLLKVHWLKFVGPILVAVAAASLLPQQGWPDLPSFYCNAIVLDFLAGMLLARWAAGNPAPRPVAAALAAAAGLALLLLPDGTLPLPLEGTTLLGATLLVGAVVNLEPVVGHLYPPWLTFLGAASYSLYLFHPILLPAIPTAFRVLGVGSVALAIPLCVAAATVAAALIYRFVEQPIVRVASRALGVGGRRRTTPDRSDPAPGVGRPDRPPA